VWAKVSRISVEAIFFEALHALHFAGAWGYERRRTQMKKMMAVFLGTGLLVYPSLSHADAAGRTGKSGKQGAYCLSCHNSPDGTTAPLVSFVSPVGDDEVYTGNTIAYTFRIERTSDEHIQCGFNVAAEAGTLSANSTKIDVENNELSHTEAWGFDSNSDLCVFPFQWEAPDEAGTYTLYGAGNAVNGNAAKTGNVPAKTTFEINVIASGSGSGDDDDDDSGDDDDDDSGDDDDDSGDDDDDSGDDDDDSGDDDDDDSGDDDDDSGDDDDDDADSTLTNAPRPGPKSAGGCSTTGMASCSLLVGLLFALGLVRKRRRRRF
jgi:hypothetical protein